MFLLCGCGGLRGGGMFWTCSPSHLIPLPSRERRFCRLCWLVSPSHLIPLPSRERGILSVDVVLLLPRVVVSRLRGNDGPGDMVVLSCCLPGPSPLDCGSSPQSRGAVAPDRHYQRPSPSFPRRQQSSRLTFRMLLLTLRAGEGMCGSSFRVRIADLVTCRRGVLDGLVRRLR